MRAVLLGMILLLPLAMPTMGQAGGSTGSTDTITFYGHVFGHGWGAPMPANTEFPVGENNYALGTNTPAAWALDPTSVCVPDCEGRQNFQSLVLFSTAGFVDVSSPAEFNADGGYSLLHNERGQTKDVQLDTGQSMEAGIWLSLDAHGWPVLGCQGDDLPCLYPNWGWDPGVFPDVVVDAKFMMAKLGEHGDSASEAPPIAEAVDAGSATVIAEGRLGPMQVINGLPGYENVYEYIIDLGTPQVDTIPRENDFFLAFDVHQEAADVAYDTGRPRFWAGEFFPPWFTMPVRNALDVERVIPTWAHGKLALLAIMNTPWGSYDVADAELSIEGPTGSTRTDSLFEFAKSSVAHGGHYLPINKTWVWDPNEDNVGPGTYTFTVTAVNHQGSAESSCQAEVKLVRNEVDQRLVLDEMTPGLCGAQSDGADLLAAELQEEVS